MRKFSLLAFSLAFFLTACGGDSGTSANDDVEKSSSSITLSSSSVSLSDSEGSSSSIDSVKSSSSREKPSAEETSSSSEKMTSSSSVISSTGSKSSSSSAEQNCSVLLEGETGWSWKVPKECRFNANVAYGSMTDTRDNKVYKTIKIGDQTWMAENLNYADSVKTPSLLKRSWCYNNKAENCDVAGRLYTWAAAIDSVALATNADNQQECGYGKTCTLPAKVQGICPPSWHLPTKTEWKNLITEVGRISTAGKVFKSQTGWNNGNGTDSVGFSALPAGGRYYADYFLEAGDFVYFWSATENNSNKAFNLYLNYSNDDARPYDYNKDFGFSVRCLKDK